MAAALPTPLDCCCNHNHCSNSGSGGSGGTGVNHLLEDDGSPVGNALYDPPANVNEVWYYFDRVSGVNWVWNTVTKAWQ